MRALLALLLPALLAPAAAALDAGGCEPLPGAQACLFAHPDSFVGAIVATDSGAYAEASYSNGTGFSGDYRHVVVWVRQDGLLSVFAGAGGADRDYDGDLEDACVCGSVQTPFYYLPWGVGIEDTDGDGEPDHVYYEPTGLGP